jgi:hypothetical protein
MLKANAKRHKIENPFNRSIRMLFCLIIILKRRKVTFGNLNFQ